MTKKIEEIIKTKLGTGVDGRVVDINFAYYNSWLIDMLRKRGSYIKYQKWEELNEINRSITQRIKNNLSDEQDDEQRTEKSLTLPKCAFITIESELAYNALSEMGEVEISGWESKLIEAPEPTNVIWENRDFDKTVRWFRLICIILLVAFVLLLTFLATVQAKILTN